MTNPSHVTFVGKVKYQFHSFSQVARLTENGTDVFVSRAHGFFGEPPRGTPFDAEVRLTIGASFHDDAYQVRVHGDLADLGARPEFQQSVRDYTMRCMAQFLGENWRDLLGVTATNNLMQGFHSPLYEIDFDVSPKSW